MTCPECQQQSHVTKTITNGGTTTRYRTCKTCNHHFITIELEDSQYRALQRIAGQARRAMLDFHSALHIMEQQEPFTTETPT